VKLPQLTPGAEIIAASCDGPKPVMTTIVAWAWPPAEGGKGLGAGRSAAACVVVWSWSVRSRAMVLSSRSTADGGGVLGQRTGSPAAHAGMVGQRARRFV
jgi:hypothetical protein